MDESTYTILPILKKIPLFNDFKEEDHQEIIKNVKLQYYPANYTIFNEGDPGELLYVIKSGQIKIGRKMEGQDTKVAILGPGEFFGEMALFSREKRNATAETVSESEVFTLSYQDFINIIKENPAIASRVSKEFLDRVKQNTKDHLSGEQHL